MSKLDGIAEYADTHDFAEEMESGTWESDTELDPMVTTSVRLPKSLLDWIRDHAARQHVRSSALIRQWLEQQRDADASGSTNDLEARVERLETAVFEASRAS